MFNLTDCVMISLAIVFGYLAFFALIDRICKCFENCAMAKYCGHFFNKQENVENLLKK